ncbi:hypothetical protein TMU01_27540 [Tenuibacillus multivorans]|nr:hypothetical protein TMU01_27540 [Tenuibacillus multivorans]
MKFVLDLDGTICFKGKPISEKILRSLEDITTKGHEVILHQPDRFMICYQSFMRITTTIQ